MGVKIREVRQIAEKTFAISLERPYGFMFRAGQYFKITLPAGRKYFCFVSSPNDDKILKFAFREGVSEFKKNLLKMALGTEIEIAGPWGDMTLPDNPSRQMVFIAGGIGITPFMSMLQLVLENDLPYQIVLLYSNPAKEQTAFFEELSALPVEVIFSMTDDPNWQGEKARLDADFIKKYIPNFTEPIYYVAGPPGMVNSMVEILNNLGIPPPQIKFEQFTGY